MAVVDQRWRTGDEPVAQVVARAALVPAFAAFAALWAALVGVDLSGVGGGPSATTFVSAAEWLVCLGVLALARAGRLPPRAAPHLLGALAAMAMAGAVFAVWSRAQPTLTTLVVLTMCAAAAGVPHTRWVLGVCTVGVVGVLGTALAVPADWASWRLLLLMTTVLAGLLHLQRHRTHRLVDGLRAELRHQSMTDDLTGLTNRRGLYARGTELLASARASGQGAAVLLVDLDGFKAVNDRFGHAAGDAVLRDVATRLRGCLRADDVVARLGGDEFAVLVVDEQVDADALAARVRVTLSEQGRPLGSVGVASASAAPEVLDRLLRQADDDMYRQKERARRTGPAPGRGALPPQRTPASDLASGGRR